MSDWLAQKVAQRVLADDGDRDIPKTVKRYVEEHKEQGADESKAWALAWSRYCKYKYPDSPHCKKDPDEYFSGRDSSSNRVASRIADSITCKTMSEYVEIDGVKHKKDTLRRLNDENMEKANQLAQEGRRIEIHFKYVDNDPDKNNRIDIEDSGGYDYSVTPIPLEALDFVRYLEQWTAEDAEQARRELEQRSSRVATEFTQEVVLPDDHELQQRGRELAEEYANEQAEKEREITFRFQHNEYGNPEVVIEDSEGPDGTLSAVDDFAILARTIDYWFADPGGAEDTDIERHITEMKGEEYKEASVLVEFNDLRSETRHEIVSWLQERGEQINDVSLSRGTITSDRDKEKWLQTKQEEPRPEIVDELCEIGSIRRPIVVDMDHDILVWGRHRLAAALKCGLDVPVITIDRQVAGRIVSRMMQAYRITLPSPFHNTLREHTSELSQMALRPFPTDDPEQHKYRLISHVKQELTPFLPDDADPSEEQIDRLISDLIREGQIELTPDLLEKAYAEVVDEKLENIESQLVGQIQGQLNDMTEEVAEDVSDLPSMKNAVRLITKLGVSEYEAQQMLDLMVSKLEVQIPLDDQQIDSLVNSLFDG